MVRGRGERAWLFVWPRWSLTERFGLDWLGDEKRICLECGGSGFVWVFVICR